MKPRLNMDKIARALGGERRGPVIAAVAGHFGALNLAADIAQRFRVRQTEDRSTDPVSDEDVLGLVDRSR
jgi:hypothetical protein